MDPIKEAFIKIKDDISSLKQELFSLKADLSQTQSQIKLIQTNLTQQTNQQTAKQLQNVPLEALKGNFFNISTGNKGVPSNNQTNQQTNKQSNNQKETQLIIDGESSFHKAGQILASLDSIKKEIRLKFKRLTPQEMLIFSKIYTLESQGIEQINYKILALELKLSESSIRDYVNKLLKKGIPVDKTKQNNKNIILSVSPDLKNIATLATILQLREL